MTTPTAKLTRAGISADQLGRLRTVIHEAGHAIAGVIYGGELSTAVVSFGGIVGTQGLTRFEELPDIRHAEVAYAGPWAEAKWSAGRAPTQREMFALFDAGSCQDARVLLASGGTHNGHGIKPHLERCWPAVLTLARKLHRDGEVLQKDALQALGISDGGGPTSTELAFLRSGGWRVPPTTAPA